MKILGWEITIRRVDHVDPWVRLLEQEHAIALAAINRADVAFHTGNLDLARAEVSAALTALTIRERVGDNYGGTDPD